MRKTRGGGGGGGGVHSTSSTSSIVEFMLDARVPPGGWKEEEARRDEEAEARVKELMEETRLWRIANSAQWVAWGIVQAKVPGLTGAADSPVPEDDLGDEFDYLAYAQERARLFWGDCVLMGLVAVEELPKELAENLKMVQR
jgi:choline kinase